MIGKDQRTHIAVFGRRNYGKSSFINAITGQNTAIVSDIAGTTTDPVKKTIEIHGFGPVVLIDTAGIDDVGELGIRRVQKSFAVIEQIDFAILIICNNQFGIQEKNLIAEFKERKIPFIIVYNKVDIDTPKQSFLELIEKETGKVPLKFSTLHPDIQSFVSRLIIEFPDSNNYNENDLFKDLVNTNDIVILVTPIDSAAPTGRMILPQVQAIRNILDHNAINIVCKETELKTVLDSLKTTPSLVVTDSQAFAYVNKIVPDHIRLTSFSTVLAKLKGNFDKYLEGTQKIANLKDGDKILILESCTHHATCEDIGRVKIPKMLQKFTNKKLEFTNVSGFDEIPNNIESYALVIQCGGCICTRKQLEGRLRKAILANVPVSNYGLTLAYVTGAYDRTVKVMQNER